MSTLFHIFDSIQNTLFPWLEQALDPLSEKEQKFVQVLFLMDLQTHMKAYRWKGKALSTIGLAVGPEHFGAVKGSILGRIGYSKDLRFRRINRDFTLFGVYGGAEFSMFGLFAVWGSAGANAGISAGPITLTALLAWNRP